MKKILQAVGLILALMVIYYVAQVIVTSVIAIIQVIPAMMQDVLSGVQPDVARMTELLNTVAAQTPFILFFSVIIALPTYYIIYMKRHQELLTFLSIRGIGVISIPVLVILGLSSNFIIELLLSLASQIKAFVPIFERYNQLANFITGGDFILSLLAVGIIGPIFEEILFRGLIFGELRKITKVKIAVVIQALLFGAYHMNIVQGSYAFIIGLLLGYVMYKSNSILAPTIVHITINSSSVLLSQFVKTEDIEKWAGALYASSFILFIAASVFILTNRSFKRTMDNSLYYMNHAPKLQPPTEGNS